MKSTFNLGRIAGVQVGVNWSVLVIVGLLTVSLAGAILPARAEGFSNGAYWVAGLIGAVGLLAAVLAHEVGHAVVARRNGINVEKITLWIFGGVAQLEDEIADPRTEAKVAGVGPAISIGLGIAFLVLALGVDALGGSELLVALVGWLGLINLILAVFNLIPGAPLDGGRLLHAFLWKRHGDRVRATKTASRAGRIVGLGLIGLGAAEFLFVGNGGGLWTALIGWVLIQAASAEERQGVTQGALAGVSVDEAMTPVARAVPDWLTLDAFVEEYAAPGTETTFAVEDFAGQVSGIVTLADLRPVPAAQRSAIRLRQIARPRSSLAVVATGTPVLEMLATMRHDGRAFQGALVYEGSELVGVITPADIARAAERRSLLTGLTRR